MAAPQAPLLAAPASRSSPAPGADEPLGARQVTLVVVRRRFRCLPCGSRLTEADPVCGTPRLTQRLRARRGQAGGTQPVAHVARSYGISPTTVRRAVQEYAASAVVTPAPGSVRRLGLDDFSLRRRRRDATGFHDLDTHRLLEVVEGRTSAAVQPALEQLAAQQPITFPQEFGALAEPGGNPSPGRSRPEHPAVLSTEGTAIRGDRQKGLPGGVAVEPAYPSATGR